MRAMDVNALFNHAIACGQRHQWNDALASYERILRLAPDHALAWNNRANVLQLYARWDESLASYDHALRIRPDYVDAVYNRATVLHRLRRWDEALAGYEKALAMKPDHPDARSNRGATSPPGCIARCRRSTASCCRPVPAPRRG